MNALDPLSPSSAPDTVDLVRLFRILRHHLWAIVATTVLAGILVYLWSSRQPQVFEATSSVLAARGDSSGNQVINTTLVSAPPLPQGAVEKALHSKSVVTAIVTQLRKTALKNSEKQALEATLMAELRRNVFQVLRVRARLDSELNGVYDITSLAPSAQSAEVLTNVATQELLDWDNQRSLTRLSRAQNSLELQLQVLEEQIKSSQVGSVDQQTFIAARATVLQSLGQVEVLVKASTGVLAPLAEAESPSGPVAPRPLQNALLSALAALFLSSSAYLGLDTFRRRVENEDDLAAFETPVLGRVPRLGRRQLKAGFLQSVRSGQLYESIGFLRVGLEGRLQGKARRLLISSSLVSEGKSSMTAALADSYARAGKRVLLIDFDLHRPNQQNLWGDLKDAPLKNLPGFEAGNGSAPNLQKALLEPRAAQALSVSDNVDVLMAGPPQNSVSHIVNNPLIPQLLDAWSVAYDIILLDSPPLMAVSDALTLARYTQGVVLVIEHQRSTVSQLRVVLRNVRNSGNGVVGFVLNKIPVTSRNYYYYQNYTAKTP